MQKELDGALQEAKNELENENGKFYLKIVFVLFSKSMILLVEFDAIYIPPDPYELTDK